MSMKVMAAACIAASLLTIPASAAVVQQYEATSAISETTDHDHSVWLSQMPDGGNNRDFDFMPAGNFSIYDDGSASLTGSVWSQTQDGGFELTFNYTDDLSAYNNNPRFKSEQGSSEQDDTYFLHMTAGTLVGLGVFEGIDFTTSTMPVPGDNIYATQIGTSANNKNSNFGLANWFFVNAGGSCSNDQYNLCDLHGTQGDINIDLTPVPLPAAGLMLLGGLGLLGGLRARRKQIC